MQGCPLGLAPYRVERGAICANALEGGEIPADHTFGSSRRGTMAGRSRGQLARSSDANRQSVTLLTKHFLLTISHYCYSNTPLDAVPRKSHQGPVPLFERQYGAWQAPIFRLAGYATRASPETRGNLHPNLCRDQSAVPQVPRAGYCGRPCRSQYGRPLRNAASPQRDDASTLRQNAAAMLRGARLMAVRNLTLTAIPMLTYIFVGISPNLIYDG